MATTLSLAMASAVLWCGGLLFVPFLSDPATVLGLFAVAIVGMALVVQWCLLVAVEFAGLDRYISRWTVALSSIQPALVAAALFTNERHWLFWRDYRIGDPATLSAAKGITEIDLGGVVVTSGPGFMLHALYAMVALTVTTALIVWRLKLSELYFRKQGLIIIAGLCGPWIGFGLFLTGVTATDWTPVGVGVLGTALFVGIFRYGLTELRPVPGETVVRNISSGIVIVTADGRINLCNDRTRELLGIGADRELIGRPLSELFVDHPELRSVSDVDATNEIVTVEFDGTRRTLSLTVSPLADRRERFPGQPTRLFEFVDITEQQRRQRELERQNERLDTFASTVSHDLRNPLNVAQGRLTIARERIDDEQNDAHLAEVADAHARMVELIDDLLTLARHGQPIDETETVRLEAAAKRCWEVVEADGADLVVERDATVVADGERLRQLLENLFRNAVEHGSTDPEAPPRDDLTIRTGPLDGGNGFYVADDGVGVPDEERTQVFESGYTTAQEGTGLGLSIVGEIADAHGWTVALDESRDGGARFEFGDRGEISGLD